ncbi:Methyltetrahydroprotoberberine 14-monooxygenase [Vitis vinifera]|uniref:Methyltetrahydroprotoberberine 14-monooxygenase n=1 Tax=Vitis vinifera TaxID=29760 RepID=A0A438K178_VITVI|nr:Methyltetrahydroprotoberberine 14-monooxygenase [Vitis vinifera]
MDPALHLPAFFVFLSLIYVFYAMLGRKKIIKSSKSRDAPEPGGAWPIIGHLHLLGGGDQLLYRTLGAMADKYGPAFNIRLGSRRAFVVSSWEVAKECFTSNDKALATRPTTVAAKHMGYNYAVFGFAPYSPFWREMRKIATLELLSNRRLEILKHVRTSEVDMGIRELYGLWVKNSSRPLLVELNRWLEDMTLNVIVRMVAGKRYFGAAAASDSSEARRCQKAINQFFRLIGIFVVSDALPFLWWLDLQGHERAMKTTAKELDSILEGWLEEHRQRRVSSLIKAEGEQDFIDIMLSFRRKGASLVFSMIPKQASSPLACNHQGDPSPLPSRSPTRTREALDDCSVAGYNVPAGTRLIVNIWKLQRDPSVWANPCAFQPERFLNAHADVDVKGQQFELMPFGSGRRSCPGVSFALQVLHLTLARLLHAFELSTPVDQPVDMTESSGLTIPKATPLEVLLTPRLNSKLYAF